VILVLVLSVALAYASPPDPSWIAGIYDDCDYDDVVGLVTNVTGVTDSPVMHVAHSSPTGSVPGARTDTVPIMTIYRDTIRGPPLGTPETIIAPPRSSIDVSPLWKLVLACPPIATTQVERSRSSCGKLLAPGAPLPSIAVPPSRCKGRR